MINQLIDKQDPAVADKLQVVLHAKRSFKTPSDLERRPFRAYITPLVHSIQHFDLCQMQSPEK